MSSFQQYFKKLPLIAILRGIKPNEVLNTLKALTDAGFCLIEIPLNSSDAFSSIKIATDNFSDIAIIGAGTVLEPEDVQQTLNASGKLIISPNFNPKVGEVTIKNEAIWIPGIATPTEAFSALKAGAHALKIFPAEMVLASGIKAMRAVLPPSALLLPVGGITCDSMQSYVNAGANGFGLGSALYRAGDTPQQTFKKALRFAKVARSLF